MTQEHPDFQTLFLETDGAIATVTLNHPRWCAPRCWTCSRH
jgi:hypothetical protein